LGALREPCSEMKRASGYLMREAIICNQWTIRSIGGTQGAVRRDEAGEWVRGRIFAVRIVVVVVPISPRGRLGIVGCVAHRVAPALDQRRAPIEIARDEPVRGRAIYKRATLGVAREDRGPYRVEIELHVVCDVQVTVDAAEIEPLHRVLVLIRAAPDDNGRVRRQSRHLLRHLLAHEVEKVAVAGIERTRKDHLLPDRRRSRFGRGQ
jgi:hypothetical protein